MVVMMFFGMSRSLGALEAPWSWIANVALLAQFPVMHSFLLTGRGRAVLAKLAPAGTGTALSTTTYVTIASLQIFSLFAWWSPSGEIWWQAEGASLPSVQIMYMGHALAPVG
jgi:methanethiol S-methyltransferase